MFLGEVRGDESSEVVPHEEGLGPRIMILRDSNQLAEIGEVVIEAVDVPSLSPRFPVSTMITSPHREPKTCQMLRNVCISSAMFSDAVSYDKYRLGLSRWFPGLVVYLCATCAFKTALRMLPACVRQSPFTVNALRSNV